MEARERARDCVERERWYCANTVLAGGFTALAKAGVGVCRIARSPQLYVSDNV